MTLTAEIEQIKVNVIYCSRGYRRDVPEAPIRRSRGRPAGGGITAEESKEAFLDAAERLFASLGYRASTMEVIAREAGYSRGSIYRHFPTRDSLVDALIQRTTQRHMTGILDRLSADAGPLDILIESMVIVATELVHDPLLKTISDESDEGTVGRMLANNTALVQMVEPVMAEMLSSKGGNQFRRDLRPKDLAQFFISTSISMLLGVIPGTEDPQTVRRYIDVFVLPAIVARPPKARAVFPD
jgi:AcrR family transcriptional regulator